MIRGTIQLLSTLGEDAEVLLGNESQLYLFLLCFCVPLIGIVGILAEIDTRVEVILWQPVYVGSFFLQSFENDFFGLVAVPRQKGAHHTQPTSDDDTMERWIRPVEALR